ncbi:MAG TPA: hypothetical protein VG028_20035 [Terriglobia bacterium]|nr:hypothetical protein [Terriglobia bacterium]
MTRRLPPIFGLQQALQVLSDRTDVLPAVGGATEDELRADIDEIDDQRATSDDTLLDEPYEFGNSQIYVPLTPLRRPEEHLFQFFLDGSMRSFFVGTALEHDRSTPVIIGQVGCVALEREDGGRLKIAAQSQRNLLLVAFSQISDEVRSRLQEIVSKLGDNYKVANIEEYGQEGQDLRRRAEDTMRVTMHDIETETLMQAVIGKENCWLIADGSLRFAKIFEELRKHFNEAQPPLVSVAKNFSKVPRFKIGRGGKAREVNLWQLLSELPEGHRTMAFKAKTKDRVVSVWYMRLRMKSRMEYPLMGVIKVELPVLAPDPPPSDLVTKLSNALLAERTVTPHGSDRRWHAHLYPIFQAERAVKDAFVSISTLRAGLRWPPATVRS